MALPERPAVLGGGNIGCAMAGGFVNSGRIRPEQVTMTRRNTKAVSASLTEDVCASALLERLYRADVALRHNNMVKPDQRLITPRRLRYVKQHP